jgi:hypothetical protein
LQKQAKTKRNGTVSLHFILKPKVFSGKPVYCSGRVGDWIQTGDFFNDCCGFIPLNYKVSTKMSDFTNTRRSPMERDSDYYREDPGSGPTGKKQIK